MNDDQRATILLNHAADLPERVQPPVSQLLARARRARRTRIAVLSGLSAVAVAAGLPLLASSLGRSASGPRADRTPQPTQQPGVPGPTPGPGGRPLAGYRWVTLARSPLRARSGQLLAWTGTELLEVGGGNGLVGYRDGAAFTPATGGWHRIAPVPGTVATAGAAEVWTGHVLFLTNASIPSPWLPSTGPPAGLYDPATNRWSVTDLPVQLAGVRMPSAVWTGHLVVVAGVRSGTIQAASYDPATGRWRVITPALPRRHPALQLALLAAGNRVVLWSLWSRGSWNAPLWGVDVLVLGSGGAWRNMTGTWPQDRTVPQPVSTGSQILVPPSQFWCGYCPGPLVFNPAYRANPETLRGSSLPRGPLDQDFPPLIWAGSAAIAIYGSYTTTDRVNGGSVAAAWDPVSDRWFQLPSPRRQPQFAATPVWTGTELLAPTADGGLLAFRK